MSIEIIATVAPAQDKVEAGAVSKADPELFKLPSPPSGCCNFDYFTFKTVPFKGEQILVRHGPGIIRCKLVQLDFACK